MTQKQPGRTPRRRSLLVGILLLVVSGCGENDQLPQGFAPVEVARVMLRPAQEAQAGDLTNTYLSAGRAFEVIEYDVPDFPCVRTDSSDVLHIPDGTTSPGGATVVYAVAPADASQPVVIAFHGNGLDFIEAEASLFVHKAPKVAQQLLVSDPGLEGYLEIVNRGGAIRSVQGEFSSAYVAEALERGWGVVAPANCWGDGGYHRGEWVDYYIPARRYGRLMDDAVWGWYRTAFPHDREREYSFGCSGGGPRTAELLLHDQSAVVASGLDSPVDYLPGFKSDPPGLFSLLAQIPGYLDVLDNFYIAHYGSLDGAAQQSLGTQLAPRGIQTPIYLAYSDKDTFATNGLTAPLVQALQARQPAERAVVWNSGEPVHCQVNTRARAKTALDWLGQWKRAS